MWKVVLDMINIMVVFFMHYRPLWAVDCIITAQYGMFTAPVENGHFASICVLRLLQRLVCQLEEILTSNKNVEGSASYD